VFNEIQNNPGLSQEQKDEFIRNMNTALSNTPTENNSREVPNDHGRKASTGTNNSDPNEPPDDEKGYWVLARDGQWWPLRPNYDLSPGSPYSNIVEADHNDGQHHWGRPLAPPPSVPKEYDFSPGTNTPPRLR
jgi:hypothetical protein